MRRLVFAAAAIALLSGIADAQHAQLVPADQNYQNHAAFHMMAPGSTPDPATSPELHGGHAANTILMSTAGTLTDVGCASDGFFFGRVGGSLVCQQIPIPWSSITGAPASFPPSGAAGGQLSGTFPNPGVIGVTETGGPTALTVAGISDGTSLTRVGSTVVGAPAIATWSTSVIRYFCIDGVSGSDTDPVGHPGFSDTSMADCGTKAVATWAKMNTLLPVHGSGHIAQLTYLSTNYNEITNALTGRYGYRFFLARATVTNSTAGSVAFSDSTNDRIMAGAVTATGMASNYTLTGTPTTTVLQLRTGGVSPSFPAELALPDGARLRFSSTTSTPALQNATATVFKTSGGDTVELSKALPATPSLSDGPVYIEMPGASVLQIRAEGMANDPSQENFWVVGLRAVGTVSGQRNIQAKNVQVAFSWATDTHASGFSGTQTECASHYTMLDTSFATTTVETGGVCRFKGAITPGVGVRFNTPLCSSPFSETEISFERMAGFELDAFVTATVTTNDVPNTAGDYADIDFVGTNPACQSAGWHVARIVGPVASAQPAAFTINSGSFVTGGMDITNAGAKPAIQFRGIGHTLWFQTPITGSTGNSDVGLDLTAARASNIVMAQLPTVTGTAGDVRLGDGTIVTWGQAAVGIEDANGNRIFTGANSTPAIPYPIQILPAGVKVLSLAGTGTRLVTADPSGFLAATSAAASLLADPGSNGIVVRTAAGTSTARTLSSDGTLTINNGNGVAGNPSIVMPAVGPGAGTYGGAGVASIALDANGRATSVATAPEIATWPVANVRWFCVDTVGGNDATGIGFSDTSSADCGTKAKKTVAGLATVFPKQGANRKYAIVVGQGTYSGSTEAIDTLLNGVSGYAPDSLIVATGTNANHGATAFAGDANDRINTGSITVPGLNAGGYNPTGTPTTTTMTCQQVGGGAASLPAEPAAPQGWRLCFSNTTSTTALHNVCTTIVGIPTSSSITYQTLGTAPSTSDVFFIEKAGAIFSAGRTVVFTSASPPRTGATSFIGSTQVVGIDMTDGVKISAGRYRFCFVRFGGLFQAAGTGMIDAQSAYVDETGATRNIGGSMRIEGVSQFGDGAVFNESGQQAAVFVGTVFVTRGSYGNFGGGSYFGAGLSFDEARMPIQGFSNHAVFTAAGTPSTSAFPNATRVVGVNAINAGGQSGVQVISDMQMNLYAMTITGVGAHPAIQVIAKSSLSLNSNVTGSSGNSDVGLDLTLTSGSDIILIGTPTVTGTAGDVRLADGTIVTWGQAAAGIMDTQANRIIQVGTAWPIQITTGGVKLAPLSGAGTAIVSAASDGTTGRLGVGSGLAIAGGNLTATGSGGTVTSVTANPPLVCTPSSPNPTCSLSVDGVTVDVNGSNQLERRAIGGDLTCNAGSATCSINSAAVTNAKLANMTAPSFKGRTTAGTGAPEDMTTTQATAMLNQFTSGLQGLVSPSGGGTANYLRADDTWTPLVTSLAATDPSTVSASTGAVTVGTKFDNTSVGINVGGGLQTLACTGTDISCSAGSRNETINANAVTFAKTQAIAPHTFWMNDTGSTAVATAVPFNASLSDAGGTLSTTVGAVSTTFGALPMQYVRRIGVDGFGNVASGLAGTGAQSFTYKWSQSFTNSGFGIFANVGTILVPGDNPLTTTDNINVSPGGTPPAAVQGVWGTAQSKPAYLITRTVVGGKFAPDIGFISCSGSGNATVRFDLWASTDMTTTGAYTNLAAVSTTIAAGVSGFQSLTTQNWTSTVTAGSWVFVAVYRTDTNSSAVVQPINYTATAEFVQ